ncbi:MAG: aminotransferase class I/II-fold pyridoxal phosphate-dependent enzyme, partial [Nitrososphaerota archaeon]
MERNYLSPPPPPPAIRAAMVKVAERLDKKLPLYDFSSGNVGRLPSKIKLFKEFKIDINNEVHESLLSIAEGLVEGIIESFYPEPKGLSYSPTGGLPYIKRLVLQYFREIHGIPLLNEDINKVTVTAGGQQALISSLRSLKKNTKLLMLRWDYDATSSTAKSHGLVEVRININEDLTIDLSDLESKVAKDSVFYLSMPNNPTGYTSPKDLKSIVEIMVENNGGVIWDAPYIFTILRLSNNKAIYDESFLIKNLEKFKEAASKYHEYMCILSSLSKTCL